ncbi:MAG: type II secretion system F family protein [Eubacteriales bacterium]|nr:type II secretion system F family protein [Eubacteriales bacterium]
MWIHMVIFAAAFFLLLGWRKGWLSAKGLGDQKSRRMFGAVVICGNLLGMILTLQSQEGRLPEEELRLSKEEDLSYEKKFLVSVEGEEAETLYIQVPERERDDEGGGEETEPEEKTREEELLEAVARYNDEKNDPDYFYLPSLWEGRRLVWEYPRDGTGGLIAALFTVAGSCVLLAGAREEEKKWRRRREELLMDYPGLVMKFTLLIQAGLTVRRTFQKMALDYRRRRTTVPRAAYEELLAACREMESGISEAEAYRRFGERCRQVKYKTFSTLLVQNLQKGSRQLGDILEKEAAEAWDERRRKARVLGEAAATKLLVPMMLMLVVVMALIMLPACLSFYQAN